MSIPKILHQTWISSNLPKPFENLTTLWKFFHRDWAYVLWTDEMNQNFISEFFPSFLSIYDNYPSAIQRVDAVRYFLLYQYGGVFIDLDFECRKNITPLIEDYDCVFGKEPQAHCILHNKEQIISNAFMAVSPKHSFFKFICEELFRGQSFVNTLKDSNDRILETTGPFMLSRLFNEYGSKNDIKVLDSELVYPLTKNEVSSYQSGPRNDDKLLDKIKNAYAIHYFEGTWWKRDLEVPLS